MVCETMRPGGFSLWSIYLESPRPKKNGVIAQNEGVVTPFSKGHGDSRYLWFLRLLSEPLLKVNNSSWFNGKPNCGQKVKVLRSKQNATRLLSLVSLLKHWRSMQGSSGTWVTTMVRQPPEQRPTTMAFVCCHGCCPLA